MTRGLSAKVDDDDYARLAAVHWYPVSHRGRWYARNETGTGARGHTRRTYRYMHKEIIDIPPGKIIDHKNGDSLDNRKENLRACTRLQNMANQKLSKRNTSGYKGVRKEWNRWTATIYKQGIRYKIGAFETAEEAARAYDAKAKELSGEFAFLNFP